ncbi:MAG TPA: hypothetical protein VKA16_09285 [Burkholderiales bacterium]|nr:hypothetical protein [Burkholderiales bacterium]
MDRVRVLAELDRRILEAYSRRTTQALRATLPLRLALPHLEPLLARNVAKEVRKDALVIRCAGDALAAGAPPGQGALDELLAQGRAIDGDFLARVGRVPIGIVVRYDEILPLRRQRIERLLDAAYRILDAWRVGRGLHEALRACYAQLELESLLAGVLRLYAMETRALSRAVRLPALLRPAQDAIGQRLFGIMDTEAARLARDAARGAYRTRR